MGKAEKERIEQLNPDIKNVSIGVRKLYNLTVFPLSFGQQIELSNLIGDAVAGFYQKKAIKDAEFVAFLVKVIGENATRILEMVTDPDEIKEIVKDSEKKELIDNITNKQLIEISEIIYEDNFKDPTETVKTLWETLGKQFLSVASLPQSSEDIPSSDSSTSLEEAIEKEDSPSDK